MRPLRVTVWNEGVHEQIDESIRERYPHGIHGAIAEGLHQWLPADSVIRTATLDSDSDHGLSDEVLDDTDVLTWWGHIAHDRVSDDVVRRVRERVHAGMGLIVLHSAHFSKIFIDLMGTTCSLAWRNEGERELVWTVKPSHPITEGIPHPIVIDQQEMYGELFDIPDPDDVIFISSFSGGEVFRSGVTFTRGRGRIFYFSPGDQDYPVYHQAPIRRVIANAVQWAAPVRIGRAPSVSNPAREWFAQ